MNYLPLENVGRFRPNFARTLLLVLLLGAGVPGALAVTWTVKSAADDGGALTLRTMVALARDGDLITFDHGLSNSTILLTQGELVISSSLVISNDMGATKLTVVGVNQRVFHFIPPINHSKTAHIYGLHLRGSFTGQAGPDGSATGPNGQAGMGALGGCILNDQNGGVTYNTLSMDNCFLEGCRATGGSGGRGYDAALGFGGNGGPGGSAYGGAIHSVGDLYLYGCTFSNNIATAGNGGDGGSGYYQAGIGGLGGLAEAGGILVEYSVNGANIYVVDCTFFSNLAQGGNGGQGGAGGLASPNGGAGGFGQDASGGGIYVVKGCPDPSCVGIVHCTIFQNVCSAGRGGLGGLPAIGGIAGTPGGNGSTHGCGVFFNHMGDLPIGNTIIAGNYSTGTIVPTGPDIDSGLIVTRGFNLIGLADVNSSGWNNVAPGRDFRGAAGAPLDPVLGPMQNNGGETPTMMPIPFATSLVIDSGDSGGIPLDQIGLPRPVTVVGNSNGGNGSDIGAVEVQCSPGVPTLTIVMSGNNLVISWPWPSRCFRLQQTTDLNMPNWQDANYQVNFIGNLNQVVIQQPQGSLFFRLTK